MMSIFTDEELAQFAPARTRPPAFRITPPAVQTVVIADPIHQKERYWYMIGHDYNRRKGAQGAPFGNTNAARQSRTVTLSTTAARLSVKYHVSPRAVRYYGIYAAVLDRIARYCGEDVREAILDRKLRMKQADLIAMKRWSAEQLRTYFAGL